MPHLPAKARRPMTWTRVPDDATETLWDLSAAAFRLHISALVYCNRHLTDGYVPVSRLAALVPAYDPAHLAELITAGLWDTVDGGYQLPGWHEAKAGPWHQPSRAEIEASRAKNAADVATWRAGRAPRNPVTGAVTPSVTKALTPGTGESLENAVPVPGVTRLQQPPHCRLCLAPGTQERPLRHDARGFVHSSRPCPAPVTESRGKTRPGDLLPMHAPRPVPDLTEQIATDTAALEEAYATDPERWLEGLKR